MPPLSLSDAEQTAVDHVRRVAHEIVRPTLRVPPGEHHWSTPAQVHTADDLAAAERIAGLFAASFPGHGLVVEDRETVAGDGVHAWWIDPIDGSANHLRGIPYVAVSAGLAVAGEPVVGVVHDVVRDVTVSAHKGGGTTIHEGTTRRRAQMSAASRLEDAMVVLHLARRGPLLGLPGALPWMMWNVRKIRCMGSIALDLLLLATGEVDLIVAGRGRPQRRLDILGGAVLVLEAGGLLLDARGAPLADESRTMVAGPPGLCRQFVDLMAGFDLEGWDGSLVSRPSPPRGTGQP